MALHGGTGLGDEQFQDLIARGCAKVNISTALKESYLKSSLEYLRAAEDKGTWDPPAAVQRPARGGHRDGPRHMRIFGSSGTRLVTALIFDCDGVLADTERYGHLPAFNATFEEFGLPVRWDEDEYAGKLRIGGGKERMASLFDDPAFVAAAGIPDDPAERASCSPSWHRTKTAGFKKLVAEGAIPARPGIARVIIAAPLMPAGPSRSLDFRRGVGPGGAGARGRRRAAARCRFSPATSFRPRSRTRPSTLRFEPRPATPPTRSSSRTPVTVCWPRLGAGLPCVVTVNGYTRGRGLRRGSPRGLGARRPRTAAHRGAREPRPDRPGDFISIEDLRPASMLGPRARKGSDERRSGVRREAHSRTSTWWFDSNT